MDISKNAPVLLCVLDGYGINPSSQANAVAIGKTPVMDRLLTECPSGSLATHGLRVGLPEGVMGNSEVGHLNIGAGRVVLQWLVRITRELEGGFLADSPLFNSWAGGLQDTTVHLIGLFSRGGVHSHSLHLFKVLDELCSRGVKKAVVHVITDGRDNDPHTSGNEIAELEDYIDANPECLIGSVSGRFYAMDRDKRWDRTQKAFKVIAEGAGERAESALQWIKKSYAENVTDEFIEPAVVNACPIRQEDKVLFWNFRADRMRQIVRAVCEKGFTEFKRDFSPPSRGNVLCFTGYDASFNLPYLFSPVHIKNHIGEVVSSAGLRQLRAAETEKYPHVTYFFNGGAEEAFQGEERVLIPSPREVKTYDQKPEMSALPVKDVVIDGINAGRYDFIVVNFANCDMVGHTGVLEAAVAAVETVDRCLGEILEALDAKGGKALIIADHGNAEQMIDYETGEPHTAHTTNPVPVVLYGYGNELKLKKGGALCDVAPTLLEMMGLNQPQEMTGESLIIENRV